MNKKYLVQRGRAKQISLITQKWLSANVRDGGLFFKKLLILWPKIVGSELARFSVPYKFATENDENILIIHVFNGSVSIRIQSIFTLIQSQIMIHIGYCPVASIRVVQKIL